MTVPFWKSVGLSFRGSPKQGELMEKITDATNASATVAHRQGDGLGTMVSVTTCQGQRWVSQRTRGVRVVEVGIHETLKLAQTARYVVLVNMRQFGACLSRGERARKSTTRNANPNKKIHTSQRRGCCTRGADAAQAWPRSPPLSTLLSIEQGRKEGRKEEGRKKSHAKQCGSTQPGSGSTHPPPFCLFVPRLVVRGCCCCCDWNEVCLVLGSSDDRASVVSVACLLGSLTSDLSFEIQFCRLHPRTNPRTTVSPCRSLPSCVRRRLCREHHCFVAHFFSPVFVGQAVCDAVSLLNRHCNWLHTRLGEIRVQSPARLSPTIVVLLLCLGAAPFEYIVVEKKGKEGCVGVITLNRPKGASRLYDSGSLSSSTYPGRYSLRHHPWS